MTDQEPYSRGNLDQQKKEIQKAVETSSFGVLNTSALALDSLVTKIKEKSSDTELAGIVNEAVMSFTDSEPKFISATPRILRENDRVSLLPGQHGGITLQFGLEDGNILRVNLYGGLRFSSPGSDMRDTDVSLRNLHDSRTLRVLSQPTQVGLHIKRPNDNVLLDVWLSYQLNKQFALTKMFYEGNKVDVMSVIKPVDYGFDQLSSAFKRDASTLITLIPSSG